MPRSKLMLVAAAAGLVLLGRAPTAGASGDWADVGAPLRPAWVPEAAERRLRLLAALPGIHYDIHTQASAYFRDSGPGLAVGLVLDDGLYYSEGFGYADSAKTAAPDERTVFRAGSLSKVITGTGLLTLIDDPARHISLDDLADEERFLPELKFVCPNFDQPCERGSQHLGIKLKHLVSHTSGLADVMEQTNAHVPVWLADLKKTWLRFKPGDFNSYSGVAVEGVGLIEQRVSGKPYVDFIKNSVFTPLEMTRSSMDETTLPTATRAQKWKFSASAGAKGWSFTKHDGILAGDDQPMIAPAGGLATTVLDLSRFIKMWLSGQAPEVGGHPLLKTTTIQSARNSQFSATTNPARCKDGATDLNNFFYSACGTAYGFGVNWWVGSPPYLQHNGTEPGLSGSETRIDQTLKMGATGLVSTEPYPNLKPQPAGLDPGFADTVVFGLLDAGRTADAATSWAGQTLADGVARVLYLSGKTPDKTDLNAFAPSFVASNQLGEGNVVAFLTKLQGRVGSCHTFRVRGVESATEIEVVLSCEKETWDIVLTVENAHSHRISWKEAP